MSEVFHSEEMYALGRCVTDSLSKRQVGVSLKHLPSRSTQPDSVYNDQSVPWQRVINSKGTISVR